MSGVAVVGVQVLILLYVKEISDRKKKCWCIFSVKEKRKAEKEKEIENK